METPQPKYTPEEQAAWAERATANLKIIDEQIEGWRRECVNLMIEATAKGDGWVCNDHVETAVARLGNMILMRVLAEQVTDAFGLNSMLNDADP